MSVEEVFRRITSALNQAGIANMLVGSFASAYYGAPRTTQAIDFVVIAPPEQLRVFATLLPSTEYYVDLEAALDALQRQSMFNVIDLAAGWKIDLVIRKPRAFSQEEFRRRKLVTMRDVPLFVASAEDVVISKLEWAKLARSQRQVEDVAGILRMRWNSLDRVFLENWVLQLALTAEWNDARRAAGMLD
jgi:hypothetical protein